MKHRAREPRAVSNLSQSFHHQLSMYALAAGAAGVGVLALAQPAEGKIVYTPAHKKIAFNHGEVFFDLNHDGINDFGFYARSSHTTSGGSEFLNIDPAQKGNAIWSIQSDKHSCAAALPRGRRIGAKRPFKSNNLLMLFESGTAGNQGTMVCPWANVRKSAYLGLKFMIKGKIHFGWARVDFTSVAILTGYAYETIPNKSIIAGKTNGPEDIVERPAATGKAPNAKPASLGLLATGSPGLSIWKKE